MQGLKPNPITAFEEGLYKIQMVLILGIGE